MPLFFLIFAVCVCQDLFFSCDHFHLSFDFLPFGCSHFNFLATHLPPCFPCFHPSFRPSSPFALVSLSSSQDADTRAKLDAERAARERETAAKAAADAAGAPLGFVGLGFRW